MNYLMGSQDYSDNELLVMKIFDSKHKIYRKDVEEALNISQTMAGRILKKLVSKELILKNGAGANTYYTKS